MSKSLEDKAIDIKGKKYVLVSDRIIYFNETYPTGAIQTELVSDPESDSVIMKATVIPNNKIEDSDSDNYHRKFTGYSQAIKGDGFINKTAALENAETSAVGRALAMMGIGVIDSVASVDEVNKAQGSEGKRTYKKATQKQIDWMYSVAKEVSGHEHAEDLDKYIESILTVKPQDVPVGKVKDAVDKIQAEKEPVAEVKEGDLTLDDIPY